MTQLGKVATKAFFVSLLILACSFTAFSQNTVSGTLQDENTSKPVQYANVSLLRQSDSVMVSYASANDKGVFQLQMVPNGKYRLVVYFVGYENYEQLVEVNKNLDLGVIKIKPGTMTIGEVVVKGERPLFAVDGEKTYYNTAEDPSVQTGTASDVLQNAPGVSVDVEGNVTLRGTSSVEIWINDKPSHMNAENLKTYLQQMPANSIDHVEVITNPSARYGSKADGIINIVTTTKVMRNQFISFGSPYKSAIRSISSGCGSAIPVSMRYSRPRSIPIISAALSLLPSASLCDEALQRAMNNTFVAVDDATFAIFQTSPVRYNYYEAAE